MVLAVSLTGKENMMKSCNFKQLPKLQIRFAVFFRFFNFKKKLIKID